eukprot:6213775-Pleurochrysis_carterae.AAC.5
MLGPSVSSSGGRYSVHSRNTFSRKTARAVVMSLPLCGPSSTSRWWLSYFGEVPRWMHLSARGSSLRSCSASGRRAYARQNIERKWITNDGG